MAKTEFIITKTKVEVYKMRSKDFAWADITIDAKETTGRISIASDYGNWQNYWGACGTSFKKFLQEINIDYCATKFGANKWFDLDKTVAGLKERISDFSESKSQKKNLLKELKTLANVSCLEEFIQVAQECNAIMYMEDYMPDVVYSIEPGFKRFWNEIWPVFLEELQKESSKN